MAMGISADWRSGFCLADSVAMALSKARGTSLLHDRRERAHTQRPRRADRDPENKMAGTFSSQADLAPCPWKIPDPSPLVVLSLLHSGLPATPARPPADPRQIAP